MRLTFRPGATIKLTRKSGDALPITLTVGADVVAQELTATAPAPRPEPSPDGTRATMVVDNDRHVWALDGGKTMRDGAHVGNGKALEYWKDANVYARFSDGMWYWWVGGWVPSPTDPTRPIVTPPPVVTPPPPPIVTPPPATTGGLRSFSSTGSIDSGSNKLRLG